MLQNASLALTVKVTSHLDRDLSKTDDPMSLAIAKTIADGTGANQGNRIFHDKRTLSPTTSENLDMFDFAGAVDPVGQPYALSRVICVIVENKNTTAGQKMLVGGEGSAAAWNSPFNGVDTDKLSVEPGGVLVLYAGSAAGYVVTDVSNYLLKIDNPNAVALDYNIVIIGS